MAKSRKLAFGLASLLAASCSFFPLGASADPEGLVTGSALSPTTNFGGLWWKAPGGSEDGWGINLAHQGNAIFATWFTYDDTGSALWLAMTASKAADGTYGGTLYRTTGPPYSATPFDSSLVTRTVVGTGKLTFSDPNNGIFDYTVASIRQSKAITRQVFGTLPTCTFGTEPNLALATNFQDLWWNAAESGWGINLTQQGNTIFATWFTYAQDGTPLWLTVTAVPTGQASSYAGTLYRASGPAFFMTPFDPKNVTKMPVGDATFTFADGNNATLSYVLYGVTQSKSITREVFQAPGTVCQ
jgi:hypothetical protein